MSAMRAIWDLVVTTGRIIVSALAGLIPGPPSIDAPPPDIDGRRPSEPDLTAIQLDALRKEGKGGFR